MDTIFQVSALAFASAIICVLLRSQQSICSVLLSLASSVLILLMALHFLHPILDMLGQLREMSQIDKEVTLPMMKIVGIGLVTQIADHICFDAGETALGHAVEISGTILSLYSALPLLSAILNLLQRILGILP